MSDVFRFETFVDVHSNIFNEYLGLTFFLRPQEETMAFELLNQHLVSLFMWMNEINSYFKCVMDVTDFSTVLQEKIREIADFYFTNKSKFFVETTYKNNISNRSDMAISATMVQASSKLYPLSRTF